MTDPDKPPQIVDMLAYRQSKRASGCWDDWCVIDDAEEFDREMRRLLESIDRLYEEIKRQEAER